MEPQRLPRSCEQLAATTASPVQLAALPVPITVFGDDTSCANTCYGRAANA